jgi:hypothetical protein
MKRRGHFFKGQMAVVMTFAIATLLGAMALGTDVAVMYFNYLILQKGADAAALAGASYLNEGTTGVTLASANVDVNCTTQSDDPKKAACTYAVKNGLATDAKSMTLNEPGISLPPGTPAQNIQVLVNRSNLPYFFGRVIGLSTYKVAAVATAADPPANGAQGLFPMGMQCTSPCSLSTLKPGSPVPFDVKFTPAQGGAPGNWQWLDNGQGAKGLGGAVTNGMSGTFFVGDPITVAPGNKGNAGPVKTAWADRFNTTSCGTYDPCTNSGHISGQALNNPCLVTVPVVDFAGCTGKNCPNLNIEAFAQIWVEPGTTPTSVTTCYIDAPDVNAVSGNANAINLGTSIIRLYQ